MVEWVCVRDDLNDFWHHGNRHCETASNHDDLENDDGKDKCCVHTFE